MKETNENEIRERIRRQLEEELEKHRNQESQSADSEKRQTRINETAFWEEMIKQHLEEEVYGSHPEFHRCINHLGEIRWLTSLEVAESYEFYLDDRGRLHRFFSRLFKKRNIPKKIPENLKESMQRYKEELELDAQKRIDAVKKSLEEAKPKASDNISEIEKKILKEETDRFYSKLPGYRKYINHLGETKWMTKEEAAAQDEFMEEVLTAQEIFFKRTLKTLAVILPLFLIWFFFFNTPDLGKAYLLVTVDNGTADLYINKKLAVSFHPNEPFQLLPGNYTISLVSKEYDITPPMEIINLTADDTTKVAFQLKRKELENSGLLRIQSAAEDANVFIDNEFQGKIEINSQFVLSAGKHIVAIEKDNFVAIPVERSINIIPNDTVDISFRLVPESKSKKSSSQRSVSYGIVEVNSNINEALIYLDGKRTPYKTDYVFQRMTMGQHVISLEKEGYKVYPEEKVFKLDKKNKNVQVNFTLTSLFHLVRIHTSPVKGDIIVDGKKVGSGLARVSLPVGKHIISFGNVKYYQTPKAREIIIDNNNEPDIYITYHRNFYIEFTPGNVLPDASSGGINTGYLNENGIFVRSKSPGPDIIEINDGESSAWSLGYAYQYRNPPGSDAIEFNFNIPANIDLSSPVKMRLYIYNSGKNYPLAVGGTPAYTILINNQVYKKNIVVKNKMSELSNYKYEEYLINHMLRRGYNKIRISTNDNTSAFLTLWKVVIK
jgi:hypothetical protein